MSSKKPSTTRQRARRRGDRGGKRVRLRPNNPFDLIRLIAHSQSDPRKAVAELVQNSLDASAKNVTILRQRRRKEVVLSVLDDGNGVFPGDERPEALERIATNIGYSFKRDLSPAQRKEEMMLGRYGIGILGFWAVGQEFEMRSRVAGSEVWGLRLVRDRPTADVFRVPQKQISFPGETWTEALIRSLDPTAARQLAGRKLGDYLGTELRGQLLERSVKLRMVDRLARGAAPRDFVVVPRRFRGRRIRASELPVEGHSPARVELYFLDDDDQRRPTVALTCAGSVVCDDISTIEGYGLDRPPWSLGCLEGIVDFPELDVVPATRRGFTPGAAADALFAALATVEAAVLEIINAERQRRRREEEENVAREIRKVFRPVVKSLPQYDFFEIRAPHLDDQDSDSSNGVKLGRTDTPAPDAAAAEPAEPVTSEIVEEGDEPEPPAEILPPGPLEDIRLAPRRFRMLPGATRKLRARAVDVTGRTIEEGVTFAWRIEDGGGSLSSEEGVATFTAPEERSTVRISVQAFQGERTAHAEAIVEVVERLSGDQRDAGIPDPQRVYDPAGDWRSRVVGRRWEYNAAHPDYQVVVGEPRRRLRYLVHLFVKEIVLRNYGEPKDERILERIVEVLTHIQSRL